MKTDAIWISRKLIMPKKVGNQTVFYESTIGLNVKADGREMGMDLYEGASKTLKYMEQEEIKRFLNETYTDDLIERTGKVSPIPEIKDLIAAGKLRPASEIQERHHGKTAGTKPGNGSSANTEEAF
jgi:hypothetical protein